MKSLKTILAAGIVCLAVMAGCGPKDNGGAPEQDAPPPNAGATPLGTLEAYYYYRDRGNDEQLVALAVDGIVPEPISGAAQRIPSRQRKLRGLVVDHEWVQENAATLYYRTWNSKVSKEKRGRPCIAKFAKRNGQWRINLPATLRETMIVTKGKTPGGFYDGTKRWWK